MSRLAFLHPADWRLSIPEKRWNPRTRTWTFRPSLANLDKVVDGYQSHVMSALLSHALEQLNAHGRYDEEGDVFLMVDAGYLADTLELHALRAGHRVGVRFTPGRSKPRDIVVGHLSRDWLARTCVNTARLALGYWDPERGIRVWARRATGGFRSKPSPTYTPDMLPKGSIKAQAEALGCSPSTVRRLRAQIKKEAA